MSVNILFFFFTAPLRHWPFHYLPHCSMTTAYYRFENACINNEVEQARTMISEGVDIDWTNVCNDEGDGWQYRISENTAWQ